MTDHRSDDRWGDDTVEDRRGRGRGALAGFFVLLVLTGLYLAAAAYLGGRVPGQTTVGGVPVGGMTQTEARTALERGVAKDVEREIDVRAADRSLTIAPADAGLSVDYDASLSGLTGFSLDPRVIWGHVAGGIERDLETDVDEEALTEAVAGSAKSVDKKPVEGSVAISDGKVATKSSSEGRALDRDDLVSQISDGWPATRSFTARTEAVKPTLAQAEIDRFVADDLEPLASGPVVVTTDDPKASGADKEVTFSVPAKDLLAAVDIKADGPKLSHTIDKDKVTETVVKAGDSSGVLRQATDAVVTHKGGTDFDVSQSKTGLGLKKESIADPVVAAMSKEGSERRAAVTSESVEPDLTTAAAKKSLPTERISTFTTYLSSGGPRVDNIKTAARQLNGAYVAPGETFSLNQHLGRRTAAKGYKEAGVIINGRLREDFGGGISQLSTTLFNAVFFSGAKIEEFHPHSFYISRYPEGREATISYPDVDNRFTNDTKGGILIEAKASDSKVTVSFYGRKTWDVEATKGPRRNVVQPKTIKDSGSGCVPQSPNVGFDVTVGRIMKPVGGGATKRSDFTTHYIPSDSVTCTG